MSHHEHDPLKEKASDVTGTALSESYKRLISLSKMNSASPRLENRFLFSGKKLQFQPFSTQRLH